MPPEMGRGRLKTGFEATCFAGFRNNCFQTTLRQILSFEIQVFPIFYVIIFLITPQDKSSNIKKTKNEPVQTIRFNTLDVAHSFDRRFHHAGQKTVAC